MKRIEERGAALVMALMAIVLMTALGSALVLLTATETRIVGHQRAGADALHAADSAIALVLGDLQRSDWNAALAGAVTSTFIDGGPTGVRNTAAGVLDLEQLTRNVRMEARRWGANAALWQPFAYGPMRALAATDSDAYAVVWVGDDPAECDGLPEVDGGACDARPSPGAGVVGLLAHAYGPQGAERAVEVTVMRDGPRLRLLSWREIRRR